MTDTVRAMKCYDRIYWDKTIPFERRMRLLRALHRRMVRIASKENRP